ncbi:uncharacterized protein LOC124261478 [Haliotis rubra]|uniref:uncharacterized protein LOC124261478 n=1 Tax=Haliotis rubra TaxID=36100 RepID=UPI001EE51E5D|nr:uncharacterized protein LOC124261478 [Haliotis rubra]
MFTSVASVYHQAREELRKSQRPTIAACPSDHPVPLPLSTAVVSPPITQTPLPNPALRSLSGSSMNLEQDILEIDLGDPTKPCAILSSMNLEQDILEIDLGDPTKPCAILSSMNLEQDIPEIDLGNPTSPFTVQPVKTESYVLIDVSHLEEPSQPQSFETACCCSVFSFIKGLFTLY